MNRHQCIAAWTGVAVFAAITAGAPSARAADGDGAGWVGTWSTAAVAPAASGLSAAGFTDQTVRNIVHTTVGGSELRIRLSNVFGTGPLAVTDVHVGVRQSGGTVVPGTDRQVTFGGIGAVTIAAGARATSDAVSLPVGSGQDLAVSIYFRGTSGPATWHKNAQTTNYFSTAGDHAGDYAGTAYTHVTSSWFFLDGIDVFNPAVRGAVVTFGPSTTDGDASTPDANARYPDDLARRLLQVPGGNQMSVLNAGISGNQLLADGGTAGASALRRFHRDVIEQAGVRAVIIWEGTNDIGNHPSLSSDQITGAWQQLIDMAHQHGIRVIGATLQPDEGAGYYSGQGETLRETVNHWMRTSGAFDGVVDFDKVLLDPSDPKRLLPALDSGDHLHPNDDGYQAIANAINLRLLTGPVTNSTLFSGKGSVNPATPAIQPGASIAATLTVQSFSDTSGVFPWTAAAAGGITVQPDRGTVVVPANATARITVTVTAGQAGGWFPVTFNLTDAGESVLAASMTVGVGVPSVAATRAPGPVSIDGKLGDSWRGAEPITVTPDDPIVRQWGQVWDVPPQGGTVRTMWDETHLYVFAQITDADILAPAATISAGAPWLDDGVAIYAAYGAWSFKLAVTTATADGAPLVAGAVGNAYSSNSTVTLRPQAAQVGYATTSTGYNLEISIDLAALVGDFHPTAGTTLRFTPLLLDRRALTGDTASIWGQMMWVGHGDIPQRWGFLHLT